MASQGHQPYSINALKRWCCNDTDFPAVSSIKELHVYDFDNTIFMSPLPNRALWDSAAASRLQSPDVFHDGGWWHNANILSATGQGIHVEEPRAWEGHWNEKVVELVRMSVEQKGALTVLLTGRSESAFADLIQRICKSKKLEFDIYSLKQTVSPSNQKLSTMQFKQQFLSTLMRTYSEAQELRLYEDRVRHVTEFRQYLEDFNTQLRGEENSRQPIDAEVIEITDLPGVLDPVTEAAEIQKLINAHNQAILNGSAAAGAKPLQLTKTVLFCAYQIKAQQDLERLRDFVPLPAAAKRMANNIMITTYPPSPDVLRKAGGVGATYRFQIKSVGHVDGRIWAAQLECLGRRAFTTVGRLQLVLAVANGARPAEVRQIRNWRNVAQDNSIQFNAVVSEVFRLAINEEMRQEQTVAPGPDATSTSSVPKKRHAADSTEDKQPEGMEVDSSSSYASIARNRGSSNRGRGARRGDARGGRGNFAPRGNAGFRARGRGYSSYRSLDDVTNKPKYADHDAQQAAKDTGVYNNY